VIMASVIVERQASLYDATRSYREIPGDRECLKRETERERSVTVGRTLPADGSSRN